MPQLRASNSPPLVARFPSSTVVSFKRGRAVAGALSRGDEVVELDVGLGGDLRPPGGEIHRH